MAETVETEQASQEEADGANSHDIPFLVRMRDNRLSELRKVCRNREYFRLHHLPASNKTFLPLQGGKKQAHIRGGATARICAAGMLPALCAKNNDDLI